MNQDVTFGAKKNPGRLGFSVLSGEVFGAPAQSEG